MWNNIKSAGRGYDCSSDSRKDLDLRKEIRPISGNNEFHIDKIRTMNVWSVLL